MNWTAVGALGESFGAVAVVLSLVYLAAQVRQNTKALRGAATADSIAGMIQWDQSLIEDPVLVRIFAQGIEDMNDLDEDGRARFVVLMLNFFKTFENMHYQFSKGAMDPDVWEGWEVLGALYFTAPGVMQYWSERRQMFTPSFREWIEGLSPPPVRRIEGIATEGFGAPGPAS